MDDKGVLHPELKDVNETIHVKKIQEENNDESEYQETCEDELDKLLEKPPSKDEVGTLEEWQVLAHIFKAFVGIGVLGLPSAVMHGGIVIGPLLLFVLGAICMYNIKLLVDTSKRLRHSLDVSSISYSSISQHLFNVYGERAGYMAKFTTDFLLCSLQIGFCCVYIVFIANNLQAAVGKLDVRVWMIVLLPFIIGPSLISDIRRLAYLTTAGNIIILIGLGVIYEYILTHINYKKDIHMLPATTNFLETCVSFGQIVYAFEGIAVILPTENKLKRRESFGWLMKIAGSLVMVLFVTVGILGYLAFGNTALGSITLNLPQTHLYQGLQGAFALMVYFTYPLQLLVSVEIIHGYINATGMSKYQIWLDDSLLRVMLVIFTCLLAICIPQLDNFMALVGSLCGVSVALVLPPILHSLCHWDYGISKWQIVVNFSITIIGVFAAVTGTVATVHAIYLTYTNVPEGTTRHIRE